MQQTSNQDAIRSLEDYTYIAIYIIITLWRSLEYIGLSVTCGGAGTDPYVRHCAQSWWYLFILIPDFLIPFLCLKIPHRKRHGWLYHIPFIALYLLYVVITWNFFQLPFFYEPVGSEA